MHSSYTIQKRDQDPEAGGADGPKKEYKEVKMSEVDEDKPKEAKEDEPLNLEEKTSAPPADDDE